VASSEALEALLYLRRAAQLLRETGALNKTRNRINAAIAEMELVIRANSELQNGKI
jgi:hypothetical protein